jgi:6-phosphofructokinase 1
MNAAIRAVVRTGVAGGFEVFGVRRGYQGMIDGDIVPMDARSVSGIINRGGTILHTARCMAFMEPDGRARAAEQLARHGIEGLVVIGGDGSYRGADKLHAEHGLRCVGLPGTIDNDIGGTQYTIGFDTALNIAMEAVDRIRDTADSHDRLFFIEVMGRRCGFIAVMASIAGGAEEVLVPEEDCDITTIAMRLQLARSRGKTSMIVIIAEGDELGNAFTVAQKVADITEFKDSRVSVVGHMQRGGSPTAFDRILASRMGVHAVEALMEGATGMMVGIENQNMVLNPLCTAWERKSTFSPDLLRVSRLLAI